MLKVRAGCDDENVQSQPEPHLIQFAKRAVLCGAAARHLHVAKPQQHRANTIYAGNYRYLFFLRSNFGFEVFFRSVGVIPVHLNT